jgi:hypothetical protein
MKPTGKKGYALQSNNFQLLNLLLSYSASGSILEKAKAKATPERSPPIWPAQSFKKNQYNRSLFSSVTHYL